MWILFFFFQGYDIKLGKFCSDPDICFAASAPNLNRIGAVKIFKKVDKSEDSDGLKILQEIQGEQAWAYFGYSLAVCDVNNDGWDELLIGSPQYSQTDSGHDGGDQGRVFVYGRTDTEQLPAPVVKGLGYAISGSQLVPGSNYPIFAVSSVVADAVVVMNTRRVVDANVTLTATPNLLDITVPCLDPDIDGACFAVKLCLSGTVRGGGTWDNMFKAKVEIDTKTKTPGRKRALFHLSDGSSKDSVEVKVDSGIEECVTYTAVVIEAQVNRDRFSPVEIMADFSLASSTDDNTTPVLDAVAPQSITTTASFKNDCGDNNICEVDLSISGKLGYTGNDGDITDIIVNGTKELLVELSISNSQEPNYWTVIEISVDSDLLFSRTTPSSDPAALCQAVTQTADAAPSSTGKEAKVICNYYKPLKGDQTIKVGVAFDTFEMPLDKKTLTVTAKANPRNAVTSQEANADDNSISLSTDIFIVADVTVNG
ncbi:integrin alpha-V [Elysia marginata]|uniref:Integrin alpha-V n=1 Tax=Elysia marginata TaxID=1093978 RepID=A0AAV4JNB7_9GAST|nr:integrin alpha-V [Elysia marginata]